MELRVLNYFLTVAREGGLTGASEVLHVTQPTMSRQIQERRKGCCCANAPKKSWKWQNERKRSFHPWAPLWPETCSSAAVKPSH